MLSISAHTGAMADLKFRLFPTIHRSKAHVALVYEQEKVMIKRIGSHIDKFGILFVGYYASTVIFHSVSNLV